MTRRAVVRRAVAAAAGTALAVAGLAGPAHADAVRTAQWERAALRVTEANQLADGTGVTVAVIDTGVDLTQSDLTGSVLTGIDYWSPTRDGLTDSDTDLHGTGMAALIAGHGHGPDGADGIRGIAPGAKILPVGVYASGRTPVADQYFADGIRWAVDHGADVLCIASGGMSSPVLVEAVKYAVDHGVPVVAGLGNVDRGKNLVGYPGSDPRAFGIAATTRTGARAAISVRDPSADFGAPGQDLQAPTRAGDYRVSTGSSNATAIAAGIIALVRQRYPDLTVEQLRDRLKATAVDKGTEGLDDEYGWGILDPVAALSATVATASPGRTSGPSWTPPPIPAGTDDTALAWVVFGGGTLGVLTLVGVAVAVPVVVLRRRRRRARVPAQAAAPDG